MGYYDYDDDYYYYEDDTHDIKKTEQLLERFAKSRSINAKTKKHHITLSRTHPPRKKVDMKKLKNELETMHKSYQQDARTKRIEKRKQMAKSVTNILSQAKEQFQTGKITGEELCGIEARIHRLNDRAASRGFIR